jgi:hypothetical protein
LPGILAARELLLAAVADPGGQIIYIRYFSGMEVSRGGRNFIDDPNPRTTARWEDAIEGLERPEFIVSRDPKREVFSVTQKGYVYAESLGITPET